MSSKNARTDFGIGAVEQCGICGDAEAEPQSLFDRIHSNVIATLATHSEVMLFALTVEVNAECQIFAGLEEMDFLFQQQRIGAQVDIFLARDQPFNDLANLGMHQRLAPRDRNHGRATFVHGAKTLFRGKVFFQDVGRILDFSASGASQVAAKQRLEHQHQRILLASGELLLQNIARHGPHLGYGNGHYEW